MEKAMWSYLEVVFKHILGGLIPMKEHILLIKAKRYEVETILPVPNNCIFQASSGYWVNTITGDPMMLGDNPNKPITKKYDIETGEDQKGE